MLMTGLFSTVVRIHMHKKCEPGSKTYRLLERSFRAAFDYNVKLEMIANGTWPPPMALDKDGVPMAFVPRVKYKAKLKMDEAKVKCKAEVAKAKAQVKAKLSEAKRKAIAKARDVRQLVGSRIRNAMHGSAVPRSTAEEDEQAREDDGGDILMTTAGAHVTEEEPVKEADVEADVEIPPATPAKETAQKIVSLKPHEDGYRAPAGWQVMLPVVALKEMCSKVLGKKDGGKHPWKSAQAPPAPKALEELKTADDLIKALNLPMPSLDDETIDSNDSGLQELSKLLLDRKVTGVLLWNAIFAAVPEELELPEETIAALLNNKEMLTRCLQKVGRAKLYAAFNTWRTKWAMEKLIIAMEEDSSDDEPKACI